METQEKDFSSHVIRKNKIIFEFRTNYNYLDKHKIGQFVKEHGDCVQNVVFDVEDCRKTFNMAIEAGAEIVQDVTESSDEHGSVLSASIRAYGDIIHSFVQKDKYSGPFLPGYRPHHLTENFNQIVETPDLEFIDHIVSNHAEKRIEALAQWYERVLYFHRFWSVDSDVLHTEYSSLKSIVMADFDEVIKMPLNEPAKGKRVSQIQEYVDYFNGSGVQHIALRTDDIVKAISVLKKRGVQFLSIPDLYYEHLKKRLSKSKVQIKEKIDELQRLGILVDFDDKGYLLQIFTKENTDRPTLFIEIIQRRNHNGFGGGNFKSLFEAIEANVEKRGNLQAYGTKLVQ